MSAPREDHSPDTAGDPRTLGRRSALKATAGAAASTLALSAGASAQQSGEPDYGDWFSDVPNYDGTVDRTGQDEVTIEVGVDTANGPYGFGPAAVRVDPGTNVVFEWVSNNHNIRIESQPADGGWEGSASLEDTGFSYEHTFETEGVYLYYCDPHRPLGMKGAVVVGDVGGGQVTEPDYGDWFSDVPNYESTVDSRGEDEVTVEVGVDTANGPYGFGPAAVRIDPGTNVTFEWVSDNHNIRIESQPGGAGWEGSASLEDTGFSYEHTFETEGVYLYYCDPHRPLGMKGAVVVGDVGGGPPAGDGGGDGDGAGGQPIVLPGGDVGFTMFAAIIGLTGIGALAVLGAELYSAARSGRRRAGDAEVAAEQREIVREIDHDEFDPVGTASLITIYFLILLGMWIFVYFVEFLGRSGIVTG